MIRSIELYLFNLSSYFIPYDIFDELVHSFLALCKKFILWIASLLLLDHIFHRFTLIENSSNFLKLLRSLLLESFKILVHLNTNFFCLSWRTFRKQWLWFIDFVKQMLDHNGIAFKAWGLSISPKAKVTMLWYRWECFALIEIYWFWLILSFKNFRVQEKFSPAKYTFRIKFVWFE